MRADHIIPVVGPEGFQDWNTFIARLYVEKEGFQAVCKDCHKAKTKQENQERKRAK
jgi:5-methylcytosine-specific restriction endonuclease McrA